MAIDVCRLKLASIYWTQEVPAVRVLGDFDVFQHTFPPAGRAKVSLHVKVDQQVDFSGEAHILVFGLGNTTCCPYICEGSSKCVTFLGIAIDWGTETDFREAGPSL